MQTRDSLTKAALWMSGWLMMMVVMAVAGREATREIAVVELMLLRSLIGLVLLYPLLHAAGGIRVLKTRRLRQHTARNLVHYGAQYGWLFALTLIPIAHVVAIEFTMPIWTALLAAAFLGERFTAAKALAVVLGVIGVLMIVRPTTTGAGANTLLGQGVAFAAAVGFAIAVTMTKSLTRTEAPVSIMYWMLIIQSAIGLLPALALWHWPSAASWPWIGLVAFCGTFSHYCMARALRHADATVVVPMDFVRVPLTALAGWAVYQERFDLVSTLGAALILAGNVVNLVRQRTDAPAANGTPPQARQSQ